MKIACVCTNIQLLLCLLSNIQFSAAPQLPWFLQVHSDVLGNISEYITVLGIRNSQVAGLAKKLKVKIIKTPGTHFEDNASEHEYIPVEGCNLKYRYHFDDERENKFIALQYTGENKQDKSKVAYCYGEDTAIDDLHIFEYENLVRELILKCLRESSQNRKKVKERVHQESGGWLLPGVIKTVGLAKAFRQKKISKDEARYILDGHKAHLLELETEMGGRASIPKSGRMKRITKLPYVWSRWSKTAGLIMYRFTIPFLGTSEPRLYYDFSISAPVYDISPSNDEQNLSKIQGLISSLDDESERFKDEFSRSGYDIIDEFPFTGEDHDIKITPKIPTTSPPSERPIPSGSGHQHFSGSVNVTDHGVKRTGAIPRHGVDVGATSPKQSHLSSSQQDQFPTERSNTGTSGAASSASSSMAGPSPSSEVDDEDSRKIFIAMLNNIELMKDVFDQRMQNKSRPLTEEEHAYYLEMGFLTT